MLRVLSGSLLGLLLLAGALAPTRARRPDAEVPRVPAALKVPAGHKFLFQLEAEGVQIYVSKKGEKGSLEWALKAPLADLLDKGKKAGYHYAGPSWESLDGSKVRAAAGARPVLAPAPRPKEDIPWLRIKLKAFPARGALRHATYVQRLRTQGGVPPVKKPLREGTEIGVKYKAVYSFYGKAD
jgi:hypothetical protein